MVHYGLVNVALYDNDVMIETSCFLLLLIRLLLYRLSCLEKMWLLPLKLEVVKHMAILSL